MRTTLLLVFILLLSACNKDDLLPQPEYSELQQEYMLDDGTLLAIPSTISDYWIGYWNLRSSRSSSPYHYEFHFHYETTKKGQKYISYNQILIKGHDTEMSVTSGAVISFDKGDVTYRLLDDDNEISLDENQTKEINFHKTQGMLVLYDGNDKFNYYKE